MPTEPLMRVRPGRALPTLVPSNLPDGVAARGSIYAEGYCLNPIRKQHLLADEGSYFVTNNAQTGVAMTTTTGFSATAPFVIVQNQDALGGKRIYLDYAAFVNTAAGSAASGLTLFQGAVVLD